MKQLFIFGTLIVSVRLQDCSNFVVNNCDRNFCDSRSVENIPTADICQKLCKIDDDFCLSFAHSEALQLCDLYSCPMSQWLQSCEELGGGKEPSIAECLTTDSGCGAFKQGFCTFDETYVISNNEQIFDAQECQEFCQILPACKFFYFDREFCTLYSAKVGKCDSNAGPTTPSYESCQSFTSTSKLPPTSTPTTTSGNKVNVKIKTIDATNSQAVTGANVEFSSENFQGSGTTDGQGMLSMGFSFTPGKIVRVSAKKPGFEDATDEVLVGSADTFRLVSLNPITGDDRIVLSWGEQPEDLDLHLVVYTESGTIICEIFYSNRECPGVTLDRDNTEGGNMGPETITLSSYNPDFIYMIYVYDFIHNDEYPLFSSNGKLTISQHNGDVTEVKVPTNDASQKRYWLAGCFKGDGGLTTFLNINVVSLLNPNSQFNLCNFDRAEGHIIKLTEY